VLAIEVAVFLPEQIATAPTVAENGAELVGAGAEEFGDIDGEGLDSATIVGPAGHEKIPSDFLAVKVKFSDAQRGPVQGGFTDWAGKRERFPQKGAGLAAVGFSFLVSDPLGVLERHRFLDSLRRGAWNPHLVPKISTKTPKAARAVN